MYSFTCILYDNNTYTTNQFQIHVWLLYTFMSVLTGLYLESGALGGCFRNTPPIQP